MKKRFQVFVSSTYEDLREERSKVMTALLELNCIPAGMELFPAADNDAWTLIKDVIDECDYYILVVAGRYGSCDEQGVSFTEKEYRYAIESGKKTLAFLHSNPGNIPQNKSEQSAEGQQKLIAFRESAKTKVCKFWSNPDDLASVVSRSLVQLINRYPGVGWIRADQLPADDILSEAICLQKQVRDLEMRLKKYEEGPPPEAASLAQGNDTLILTFEVTWKEGNKSQGRIVEVETTWDRVFETIARTLFKSPTEREIGSCVVTAYQEKWHDTDDEKQEHAALSDASLECLRIQFRALGLVTQEHEQHARELGGHFRGWDSFFRWHLTPFGDQKVTQMLARRKLDAEPSPAL